MNLEIFSKVALTIAFTAVWLGAVHWVWVHQLDPGATIEKLIRKPFAPPDWVATREPNKLYQDGRVVAEVIGPIQEKDGVIYFSELANTSDLDQRRDFQYQRRILRIRQVGSVIGVKAETFVSDSQVKSRTLTAVLENVVCIEVR